MTDFENHILRQMAHSRATFGPGERFNGVIDHIRKELRELEELNNRVSRADEWVDVVILALDGLWRNLEYRFDPAPSPEEVANMVVAYIARKQGINERRKWPDWRQADPDKAIEHKRTP